MKINLEHSGIKMEITYNRDGYLDFVKNIETNEFLMLETRIKGSGFKIQEESFMIGGKGNVCDARYARIMDVDIFIPKFIFIPNVVVSDDNEGDNKTNDVCSCVDSFYCIETDENEKWIECCFKCKKRYRN